MTEMKLLEIEKNGRKVLVPEHPELLKGKRAIYHLQSKTITYIDEEKLKELTGRKGGE